MNHKKKNKQRNKFEKKLSIKNISLKKTREFIAVIVKF